MKAALSFAVLHGASAEAVNPMTKVISMLGDLRSKVVAEGDAEAKAYKEFFSWCDDAAANKGFEIKTAKAKKEDLEATIEKATSDISESSTQIEELAASISKAESELADATAVREKEKAEFTTAENELMSTVDALDRAIAIISREANKNPAAFAQMDTSNVNSLVKGLQSVLDAAAIGAGDQKLLMAMVQNQQGEEDDDQELTMGAPAAAAYKSHGGGILDVLDDLKEKAESELADLRKAEQNSAHNFDMLKQSLTDQLAADNKDKDDETNAKNAAEETKATAEGDLSNTVKDLADASNALEIANSNCMQVAADHEATVNSRNAELAAIDKATQILKETSSGAVSQSYSFAQINTRSTFKTRADLANAEVATVVKRLAKAQHSQALAQLASRIEAVARYGTGAGEDVFAKIKGMISDMIAKLEQEASDDATEKAYCDEEMAKTEAKKADLDGTVETLTSRIDRAAAASAKLKEEVKEAQQELAALAKSQAEIDNIRAEEHSDYVQAKKDLELGLEGVGKALGVLRDYYGGGAAMLQDGDSSNFDAFMQQPAMPEKHTKAGGAGESIINMLEVVESDFSKNLATEESAEADAVAVYEKTCQENKVTKTLKDQDVKYKTQEFKGLDKDISDLSSDKGTASTELAAVNEYYAKLKDRCIAKPESYEERKARREAEIQGLKEALQTLEEETAFVQRKKHGVKSSFLGL
jgi:chromosome segregation ATPase